MVIDCRKAFEAAWPEYMLKRSTEVPEKYLLMTTQADWIQFQNGWKARDSKRESAQPVEYTLSDIENAIKNAQPERIIVRQELRQRDGQPIEVLHEKVEIKATPHRQALAVMEMIQGKLPKREVSAPKPDKFIISEMLMSYVDGRTGQTHQNYGFGQDDENGMRNVLALLIGKGWKQL